MSKAAQWVHGGKEYRIVGLARFECERGYAEPSEEHYNVLQVKVAAFFNIFSWWKDVEEEHVPSHAWISMATLGWMEWESKLFAKCRQQYGLMGA